jgi:hypothetical protein
MDGGSSLNVMYSSTLDLMGIGLDKLWPSKSPFHGVAPGKRVQSLMQIDLSVFFATLSNFRRRSSPLRWWGSGGRTALLTVKIRQPSHEFTFGVGMTFVSYSLVLTPVV